MASKVAANRDDLVRLVACWNALISLGCPLEFVSEPKRETVYHVLFDSAYGSPLDASLITDLIASNVVDEASIAIQRRHEKLLSTAYNNQNFTPWDLAPSRITAMLYDIQLKREHSAHETAAEASKTLDNVYASIAIRMQSQKERKRNGPTHAPAPAPTPAPATPISEAATTSLAASAPAPAPAPTAQTPTSVTPNHPSQPVDAISSEPSSAAAALAAPTAAVGLKNQNRGAKRKEGSSASSSAAAAAAHPSKKHKPRILRNNNNNNNNHNNGNTSGTIIGSI
jgi:hypothetical protein